MTSTITNPFAAAASRYRRLGWSGTLPLPWGAKTPPPPGFTGRDGGWPSDSQIEDWLKAAEAHNIAIRLPEDVIGLDVDLYDDKPGLETVKELVSRFGLLPATWNSTSRTDGSGIRFFRVTPGLEWPGDAGPGVELISHGYRYAVVAPSVHPTRAHYRWLARDLTPVAVPPPKDLPLLPQAWVEGLRVARDRPRALGSVSSDQRWTRERPCPVCAGWQSLAQGQGARCHGYMDSDKRFARCSREERALNIEPDANGLFPHRLGGRCGCGGEHRAARSGSQAKVVFMNEVQGKRISWLWRERIALGKLTLLDGDPGQLKSAITLDLAARISTGREMPDGTPGLAGGVVLLSFEDDPADTIRPRLDAVSADLSHILLLRAVGDGSEERLPSIPDDLDSVRSAVAALEVPARLIVIDPLMAALSSNVNSHRDQDVRRALAQLARLAEELQVAVVVIRHLNKGESKRALYRGGGSIGIAGAARSVLLVGDHPDHQDEHVLAAVKANLAQLALSMRYRARPVKVEGLIGGGDNRDASDDEYVTVQWLGTSPLDADSLLDERPSSEEKSALDEAKDFLRQVLADGPVLYKEIQKQAKDAGVSMSTAGRAKRGMNVLSRKRGMDGPWAWALPSPPITIEGNELVIGEPQ